MRQGKPALSQFVQRVDAVLARHFLLWFIGLFVVLMVIKGWGYLPYGRFWHEEITIFFPAICRDNGWAQLFFIYNGHLELWTNAVMWLATHVPYRYSAMLSTYASVLLQAIPFLIIALRHHELGLNRLATLGVVLVGFGMPAAMEVWANAINLHFHFALVAALVAILPASGRGNGWHIAAPMLLLAAGLSGIPANFLAPLFVFLAVKEQNKGRWIQAGIISATCLLQIGLLMASYGGLLGETHRYERDPIPSPFNIFFATIAHSVYGLFLGADLGMMIGGFIANIWEASEFVHASIPWLIIIASLVVLYRAFGVQQWRQAKNRHRAMSYTLIAAALIITGCSITLAITADMPFIVNGVWGYRYFFAPNMLWVILFFAVLRWQNHWGRLLLLCLVVSSLYGVPQHMALTDARTEVSNFTPLVAESHRNRYRLMGLPGTVELVDPSCRPGGGWRRIAP